MNLIRLTEKAATSFPCFNIMHLCGEITIKYKVSLMTMQLAPPDGPRTPLWEPQRASHSCVFGGEAAHVTGGGGEKLQPAHRRCSLDSLHGAGRRSKRGRRAQREALIEKTVPKKPVCDVRTPQTASDPTRLAHAPWTAMPGPKMSCSPPAS